MMEVYWTILGFVREHVWALAIVVAAIYWLRNYTLARVRDEEPLRGARERIEQHGVVWRDRLTQFLVSFVTSAFFVVTALAGTLDALPSGDPWVWLPFSAAAVSSFHIALPGGVDLGVAVLVVVGVTFGAWLLTETNTPEGNSQ